jgi:hypothetical protein
VDAALTRSRRTDLGLSSREQKVFNMPDLVMRASANHMMRIHYSRSLDMNIFALPGDQVHYKYI